MTIPYQNLKDVERLKGILSPAAQADVVALTKAIADKTKLK